MQTAQQQAQKNNPTPHKKQKARPARPHRAGRTSSSTRAIKQSTTTPTPPHTRHTGTRTRERNNHRTHTTRPGSRQQHYTPTPHPHNPHPRDPHHTPTPTQPQPPPNPPATETADTSTRPPTRPKHTAQTPRRKPTGHDTTHPQPHAHQPEKKHNPLATLDVAIRFERLLHACQTLNGLLRFKLDNGLVRRLDAADVLANGKEPLRRRRRSSFRWQA